VIIYESYSTPFKDFLSFSEAEQAIWRVVKPHVGFYKAIKDIMKSS